MDHLEIWELEQQWDAGDEAWLSFVTRVEEIIGRELDGDEGDGLSLDGAYNSFRDGVSPNEYVLEVLS